MRFMLTTLFGLIMLATIGLACDSAAPVRIEPISKATATPVGAPATEAHSHAGENEAPRISLAEAKKAFDEGEAYFIDVRGEDNYKNEHIKGAVNIRPDNLEARYKEIPGDKKIIVYCS